MAFSGAMMISLNRSMTLSLSKVSMETLQQLVIMSMELPLTTQKTLQLLPQEISGLRVTIHRLTNSRNSSQSSAPLRRNTTVPESVFKKASTTFQITTEEHLLTPARALSRTSTFRMK